VQLLIGLEQQKIRDVVQLLMGLDIKNLEMLCNSLWDLTNTKIRDVVQLIMELDQQKIRDVVQALWDLTNTKIRDVVQLFMGLDPPQEGSKIYPLPLAYFLLLRIIFLNFQLFTQTSNPSFDSWLKV
jgi:hypothetical protein